MIDPDRWTRLIFHVLDEVSVDNDDPVRAERAAVHIYAAIWRRLNDPEGG